MIKYYDIPQYDREGNPNVNIVQQGDGFIKLADYSNYPDEMQQFINNLKPEKGIAYLLISALGDWNWGANRNADLWPAPGLKNETPEFGHKTYEEYGHYYHGHANKDPNKSFGKVVKAIWQDDMGRVLLIIKVDLNKDKETKEAIEKEDNIECSMGAKVAYDICNVCHPNYKEFYKIPEKEMKKIANAKTVKEVRDIGEKYGVDLSYISEMNPDGGPVGIHSKISKYCDHMKYHRNQILDNGIKVAVTNLRPVFFDISKVNRNADKSSFVLAKVAKEKDSEKITEIELDKQLKKESQKKKADVKKADIKKKVEGEVVAKGKDEIEKYYKENILPELYKREKEIPDEVIERIAQYPISDILSSFVGMGMFPHPKEFQKIVLISLGKKKLSDEFDKQKLYITEEDVTNIPQIPKVDIPMGGDYLNDDIMNMLMPFLRYRSYHRPHIVKRIVVIKKAGEINAYLEPRQQGAGPLPGMLASIAAFYGLSKLKGGESLQPIIQKMVKHKGKVLAAILGATLAAKLISQSGAEYSENVAFNKRASFKGSLATILGFPIASYLWASHIINKAKAGQPISGIEKTIAKHPLAIGVGSASLAHPKSRKIIFDALSGTFKGLKGVKKMAEEGLGFEGLDINDYPVEEQDAVIVTLWDELHK